MNQSDNNKTDSSKEERAYPVNILQAITETLLTIYKKAQIDTLRGLLENGPDNFSLEIKYSINKNFNAQFKTMEQQLMEAHALRDRVYNEVKNRSARNLQNAVWRDYIINKINELESNNDQA